MLNYERQAAPWPPARRVREAFSHLVISQRVLISWGPRSMPGTRCSCGPPGNGKTVISQAVGRLMQGDIGFRTRSKSKADCPALRSGEHEPIPSAEDDDESRSGLRHDHR
jgi:hypothetical protein